MVNYNLQTMLQALPQPLKKEYASAPIEAQYNDSARGAYIDEQAAVDESVNGRSVPVDELVYEAYTQD